MDRFGSGLCVFNKRVRVGLGVPAEAVQEVEVGLGCGRLDIGKPRLHRLVPSYLAHTRSPTIITRNDKGFPWFHGFHGVYP